MAQTVRSSRVTASPRWEARASPEQLARCQMPHHGSTAHAKIKGLRNTVEGGYGTVKTQGGFDPKNPRGPQRLGQPSDHPHHRRQRRQRHRGQQLHRPAEAAATGLPGGPRRSEHSQLRRRRSRHPVSAENSAVGVDLQRRRSILIPRVSNLVPIPGITGSAHCAVRPLEGPRDHRLAPPTRSPGLRREPSLCIQRREDGPVRRC